MDYKIEVFCCYAHKDQGFSHEIRKRLKPLKIISAWSDSDISSGSDWKQEIHERLHSSQIILLLVSRDFMASDSCIDIELQQAKDRHKKSHQGSSADRGEVKDSQEKGKAQAGGRRVKPARKGTHVSRRFSRREQTHGPDSQRRVRRAVTVTERTVITLEEAITRVHAGERLPRSAMRGTSTDLSQRQGRCADIPPVHGGTGDRAAGEQRRLRDHQTVDETHQEWLARLEPLE